jgi:hypothetical protein
MASSVARRPLPAIIALLALLALTALVWWRVLDRSDGKTTAAKNPCTSAPSSPSGSPSPSSSHGRPAQALPAPSSVTVRVLNSTTRNGIAGKAQAALIKAGFRSPMAAGNDEKHQGKIRSVAQIRYGTSSQAAARLLQYYFPGAKLVPTAAKRSVVTVSLGKRYRHVAKPRRVQAEIKADGVTVSGSPTPHPTTSAGC